MYLLSKAQLALSVRGLSELQTIDADSIASSCLNQILHQTNTEIYLQIDISAVIIDAITTLSVSQSAS